MPIKTQGWFDFMKLYAKYKNLDNIFLGINLTEIKYSDGTDYTDDTFDFAGDSVKLEGKQCAYLKRGIGYKVRGFDCTDSMAYICLWKSEF